MTLVPARSNGSVLFENGKDSLQSLVTKLRRLSLEGEPEEWLGVGRSDVEPPIGVIDRDSIQVVLLAVTKGLLDVGEGRLLVGHFEVDLAGMEILA